MSLRNAPDSASAPSSNGKIPVAGDAGSNPARVESGALRKHPATVLAWLAGVVDGEGCIYIHRTKPNPNKASVSPWYQLELKVKMVHKPTIERFICVFGGAIRKELPGKNNVRVAWRWSVSGKTAARVLDCLLPFLFTKKPEALLALKFSALSFKRVGNGRLDPSVIVERDYYWQALKDAKTSEFLQ